jgi:hypothetical protein
MKRFPVLLVGALFALILINACDEDDPAQPAQPVTHDGQSAALGQGQVTAYERVAADGTLLAVGVRFSEATLSGLPTTDTPLSLTFPRKVANSPFVSVGFDWNPFGHFPAPIYGSAHFDVHFYVVDEQTRAAVVPGPDLVPPAAQYMPQDYMSAVDAVPYMGTHYIDSTAAEFHGAAFDKTFIYGFYRGDLFFLEPMVTKAFFETKPNVTVDIKQPAAFKVTGKVYPKRYTVNYDSVRKEYTVELTTMQLR